MNLRDLHYFVVLAKTQHFGEAAKLCHVSQPTLSMQIKKLEEELGLSLFERNNKHVMLTTHGHLLVERAREVLTNVAEMKELARSVVDPFSGELRLGVIPTLAPYLLPQVMPQIKATFPKLEIWLVEEKTDKLIDKLTAGQLDAAIMAAPINGPFNHQVLFDEPFYFACDENSPLASKQSLQLKQLADLPLMLLEEGHCLREQAMAICKSAKADPRADFSATSLETLRLMVTAGLGVTLMPALAVQDTPPNLHIIPFTKPAPFRTIALYWRPNSVKVKCLSALGLLIREIVHIA